MSRFTPHFFDSVYRETPPWEIGAAQPAMTALRWRIVTVRPARFESRIAPVPALAACIERFAADAA